MGAVLLVEYEREGGVLKELCLHGTSGTAEAEDVCTSTAVLGLSPGAATSCE